MIMLGCLLGYVVVHMACMAALIKLRPEWVLEMHQDTAYDPEKQRSVVVRTYYEGLKGGYYLDLVSPGTQALMFAPFMLVLGVPLSLVVRASTRSVNDKTRLQAELEAELAAARKEIDDLLGRKV